MLLEGSGQALLFHSSALEAAHRRPDLAHSMVLDQDSALSVAGATSSACAFCRLFVLLFPFLHSSPRGVDR